jgi:serine/threonine-protein kinase
MPLPKTVGSFEILQEIGEGGMGVIYLGRQPALDRPVVLKKIHRRLLEDRGMLERFQREARVAAALHHQNVVAVYDCFAAGGDHYIAQELVDGRDLQSILREAGKLDAQIVARVALEVIRGLEEIHARGIIHRDLKPANVLIGSRGQVKIADFGIAFDERAEGLTHPGTLLGSVPYMSPEQMLGERLDYRSDLFAFGVLLYEMLTGRPPYLPAEDPSTDTLLRRIQKERFDPPTRHAGHVPLYIRRLVRSCLRAKPSRRVQSATAVRRQLARHLGGLSQVECRQEIGAFLWEQGMFRSSDGSTEVQPVRRPRRAREGRWLLPAAAMALLVVSVAGFAAVTWRVAPSPVAASVPAPLTSASMAGAAPVAAEPAKVRFVADPWAEVQVEDGERFFTPRAAPVALAPGRHRVVFQHPGLGRAEYTLDLRPGEERVIRHVYGDPGP